MANLITLNRRIKVSKNIAKTTRAMQMVAASKTKKAQANTLKTRPYADKLAFMVKNLLGRLPEDFSHPYLTSEQKAKKTLLVAISPDKGLCGSLISNLRRELIAFKDGKNLTFLTVGKKLASRVAGEKVIADFPMGVSQPEFSQIVPIVKIIGEFNEVFVLYAKFENFFTQKVTIEKLLPIQIEDAKPAVSGQDYLFEPNTARVLESLLPHYLESRLFQLVQESFASEQVARMIAMQNATDNAQDVIEELTLAYNKARQEKITNEILDIARAGSALSL
ncbi:ATP synthase F1 subunit gamma [Candidatus Microgenomates bacterium]|nr:ATP synthase F1 subunit gamma [Candidatus Microgenomates bacterium]MBI2622062.1 ATP synthase F1 subunit gamma [Candidatus Microgenomates bacterium]